MDWIKQLNKVMDYIDDKIAEIACCSIYNFQRMFSYIAQTSLSDYIRSRRLTLAAFDIIKGSERIIDIASKYGYDSQDAFSRAFRRFITGFIPNGSQAQGISFQTCR